MMLHITDHQGNVSKTTTGPHYTHIRLAQTRTLTPPNAGEDVEQQVPSFAAGGMQHGTATLEDGLVVSYNTKLSLAI